MDNHQLIESLRNTVIEQSSTSPFEENGCKRLSEEIFASTKNYISEKTLVQFFSFSAQAPPPKPFVLNSICQFIGFQSWSEYIAINNTKA